MSGVELPEPERPEEPPVKAAPTSGERRYVIVMSTTVEVATIVRAKNFAEAVECATVELAPAHESLIDAGFEAQPFVLVDGQVLAV